jgi:phospholipid/cholesterol/gamma-HCH transport system ATP-binding protein
MATSDARTGRSEPVIQVENLGAGYERQMVLEAVSFTVAAHETLAIVGPSGCGKSTLLRCLIGLLRPLHGKVRILGRDVLSLSAKEKDLLRRQMGVAFQGSALLNSLSVGDNVALPLREHTELDAATITIMTRMKLEQVGLRGAEEKMPSELSGGMRKRAGIARALAMDPKVLFLDEPSAGLDPITAAGLDELLVRLRGAHELTMIVVTHELASMARVADRVLMLDAGKVRIQGTLDDVAKSKDPRVRQFFDRKSDADSEDSNQLVDELMRGAT